MREQIAEQALIVDAAEHATARVPTARPEDSVSEVRKALTGASHVCVDEVAVLEGTRLAGLVPLRRLLSAADETRMAEVMDPDPPVIGPGVEEEVAAWTMVRRGEPGAAVIDAEGRFVGLIPSHRMLGLLLTAHDEDMARLGGYLASTDRARLAAEEPIGRRLLHRLPWLLVGLVGAMASAVIVGAFEEQLDSQVLLAFFLPAVIYMADAVGTQTETILIRGLSVNIRVATVFRRELLTGLVIGLLVAVAFFPFALIGWGDEDVAAGVSLALFASCSIATSVGMALPWLIDRLGGDPAFGAGPLATIIQDLLSIIVYLAIAAQIAT